MSAVEEIIEPINVDAPVTLRITSAGIKAEFENNNGRKVFKNIGLQSMSRILNKDSEFDTGFLPIYGNSYIGIKRYIKMGDKELLFIEASPSNRLVKFGYDNLEEIPKVKFPGILMSVVCRVNKDGSLEPRDTRLFATRGPVVRDSDVLYKYPFGNVYSDGKICWGSVQYDRGIKNLTHAGSLLDLFLSTAMNTDLYSRNSGLGLKDLLKSLQDQSEFPYEDLTDANMSFRGLTSLLKGKNVG